MWYYADEDKTFGPMPKDDLVGLIAGGRIKKDTLVWHENLDDWIEASSLDELANLFAREGPPPLPGGQQVEKISTHAPIHETETAGYVTFGRTPTFHDDDVAGKPPILSDTPTGELLAKPWPRYWARFLDVLIFVSVIAFGFGFYITLYHPTVSLDNINDAVFGMIVLVPALFFMAVCMAVFGNTPGKALLGLKVRQIVPENHLWFFIRREFNVWVRGLGFGIPIVTLFTNYHQYKLVKQGLPASYDGDARVVGKPIGFVRAFLAVVIIGTIFAGLIVLNAMEKQQNRNTVTRMLKPDQTWTNPITKQNVSLAGDWSYNEKSSSENDVYYFTDSQSTQAMLAHEPVRSGMSLVEYADLLKQAVGDNFDFTAGSETLFYDNRMAIRIVGTSKKEASWSIQITAVMKDEEAWRTIVVAQAANPANLPTTEPFVKAMLTGL